MRIYGNILDAHAALAASMEKTVPVTQTTVEISYGTFLSMGNDTPSELSFEARLRNNKEVGGFEETLPTDYETKEESANNRWTNKRATRNVEGNRSHGTSLHKHVTTSATRMRLANDNRTEITQ
jgi:hypothetical protein